MADVNTDCDGDAKYEGNRYGDGNYAAHGVVNHDGFDDDGDGDYHVLWACRCQY